MNCPLCLTSTDQLFFDDVQRKRRYWECSTCTYVFADRSQYLEPEQEKDRYAQHNNGPEHPGYVQFLSPVVDRLKPYLKPGELGLDYGSGPGPIMPLLLAPLAVKVDLYDPYFHPRRLPVGETYDFVTCTEAFEHFYQPHRELDRIVALLKPHGVLLVMTQFCETPEKFANWGYRFDETHVGFLTPHSLQWLANNWGLKVLETDGKIAILKKN